MEPQLLPPWTKKRRLTTLVIMMGFILLASLCIGYGIYQVGVDLGVVKKPFSKQQITKELLNDAGFIRAIQKEAANKQCENRALGFGYYYQSPFVQVNNIEDTKCAKLVTLHATGADVIVEIKQLDQAREVYVTQAVLEFDQVDTNLMSGTKYQISRLSGIRQGIGTEMYVVGIDRQSAYLITYAPIDPTLTGKVIGLVESFYSIPQ